jgi:uncharacterized membrane protein YkvA (DUF1232 family)
MNWLFRRQECCAERVSIPLGLFSAILQELQMNPIVVILCLLYVLSPIDFLPDVVPVLGWLDDLGVLGYLGYGLIHRK